MMTSCLRLLGLMLIVALQPAQGYHVELPEGMSPARATWLWGHHSIPGHITRSGTPYWYVYPHTDVNKIENPVWSDVAATQIKPGARAPAVVVLHGCAGLTYGPTEYRRFFIASGYAIFEPDSYARFGRGPGVKRCDEASYYARVEELEQALVEIRKLEWVDRTKMFLMGISEGGSVVAGWSKDGFAGHIIMSADCWAQKNRVPAAPLNVPVLAIVGANDKHSTLLHRRRGGEHCNTETHANGSKSIQIRDAAHAISEHPETGKAVVEFLRNVTSR